MKVWGVLVKKDECLTLDDHEALTLAWKRNSESYRKKSGNYWSHDTKAWAFGVRLEEKREDRLDESEKTP